MKNDLGQTVIYAPNDVDAVMIFRGSIVDESMTAMPLVFFDWHCEPDRDEDFSYITLDEIYQQFKKKTGCEFPSLDSIITVVVERPLSGEIYQCGNYGDGVWVKHGTLRGYA